MGGGGILEFAVSILFVISQSLCPMSGSGIMTKSCFLMVLHADLSWAFDKTSLSWSVQPSEYALGHAPVTRHSLILRVIVPISTILDYRLPTTH